ncbi:serine/arginine-rich splicing factor 6-like [Anneissia japonica]|uniref:serine/arginine-rich splicing factor 6-like n=1 Tax=Anneissia japonica TaxID=1529436 RepID=UPI001425BA68|nr:serine/arginine-rich splicing factor 6-like [Anneissia japonica]
MGSRIYIGRLNYQAREKDVERFFKGYGRIREINLKNGFGFVEFDDYRDADDAVYELNGRELCNDKVIIEHARGPGRRDDHHRGGGGGGGGGGYSYGPPRRSRGGMDKYGPPVRTEFRVIVENLSSRVSWQDLKDYMRQAGEVTFADAHKQHKNEGIVEFATLSDMRNAISKLDDSEINGRRIRIVEDRPRKSHRSRSPSRSQSRSRSRSRSRHSRSKSRSKSRSRSRSKSRSRSRSKSPCGSKSPRQKDRSKSRSRSRSKSRSASPKKDD